MITKIKMVEHLSGEALQELEDEAVMASTGVRMFKEGYLLDVFYGVLPLTQDVVDYVSSMYDIDYDYYSEEAAEAARTCASDGGAECGCYSDM